MCSRSHNHQLKPAAAGATKHAHAHSSRRDFFQTVMGALTGVGILQLAQYRAAWAQALTPGSPDDLFDIEKVADDVFYARARPAAIGNCNAAIFVNSGDVLVVDAHSKPSAAASLMAQIKRDITPKPVRYLVDTHFHWDHSQGNGTYAQAGAKIVASKTTKRLMQENTVARLHATMDPDGHGFPGQPRVPVLLEAARKRLSDATSEQDRMAAQSQIRQLEAFSAEMKNFSPSLPTITFDKSYVIKDKNHQFHLQFHGRAHTAGDIVIFCPEKRVVAVGDVVLGQMPFFADGYPKEWPKTIDSIGKLGFDQLLPGHGRVQQGRQRMVNQRNYIEELTSRVETGKKAGSSVADLQKTITADSLSSLRADGYAEYLAGPNVTAPNVFASLQTRVNNGVEQLFNRLDQAR